MKFLQNSLARGTWRHYNDSSMDPPPISEMSCSATGSEFLHNGLCKYHGDRMG